MANKKQRKEIILTLNIIDEEAVGGCDLIEAMCEDSLTTRVKDMGSTNNMKIMIINSKYLITQIAKGDLSVVGVVNHAIVWRYAKYNGWEIIERRALMAISRLM